MPSVNSTTRTPSSGPIVASFVVAPVAPGRGYGASRASGHSGRRYSAGWPTAPEAIIAPISSPE